MFFTVFVVPDFYVELMQNSLDAMDTEQFGMNIAEDWNWMILTVLFQTKLSTNMGRICNEYLLGTGIVIVTIIKALRIQVFAACTVPWHQISNASF